MSKTKLPAKKIKEILTERANLLRSAGFNIAFKGNRKSSPQQRGAVQRLWFQKATYLKPEHGFKYKKLSRSLKRRASVSDHQKTPRGIFVQVPSPRAKVTVDREGGVQIRIPGELRHDTILKLDPIELAKDPLKEIKRVLKKRRPRFTKIQINGYEIKGEGYTTDDPESVKLFYQYWEGLIAGLTDQERRDELAEEHPRDMRYKGRAMSTEEAADMFTLKLIYQ